MMRVCLTVKQSSGVSDFPESVVVRQVVVMQAVCCNTNTKIIEIKQDWVRDSR